MVFKIRDGKYETLRFNNTPTGVSATNTLTFMADSAATVIFDGGANGTGMVFKDLEHTTFQGLTFGNTTDGAIGVQMQGACTDVTIRECNIYASVTATASSYRAFDYPNTSGSANYPVDVRLIGNHIAGGYYNLYLYYTAGSTSYMTSSSMYIDSNVMTDAYYYGIYAYYYGGFPSISHNTISNRYAQTSGNSSIYYGLYSSYYKNFGEIVGNKIFISNTSSGYGMYLYYYQNYPTYSNGSALIANNEIRVMGNGVKYGMYLYTYYSNMEIHHNSVYASSETSTAYGAYLYAGSSTAYKTNFTRNLLYAEGMTEHPLYLANGTMTYNGVGYGLREWNVQYATGGNVGYAGGVKTTVADFQSATGQDSNINISRPSFVRLRDGMELNDYDPFTCPGISSVTTDLNGNPRNSAATAAGCYGAKMWDGVNLLVDEFVSPVTIADVLCYEDSTAVEIVIKNMGRDIANFDSNALKVDLDVTGAISHHFDTTFSTGSLRPTQAMNIRFPKVFTKASGIYNIKVKLTSLVDVLDEDDTMSLVYNASRVDLPYDIDFSSTPDEFVNTTLAGNVAWEVVKGTGTAPALSPDFGTGRLEFKGVGNPGAFANAIFNAVNIQNCINPKLSFWYAHSADNARRDLTVVLASTDGGASFTELGRISQADTFTGWRQYDIDLSRFANDNCLSIVFQAISYGGANQSLDRVRITADQDAAISLIPVDLGALSACRNNAVPLQVVVSNQSRLIMEVDNDTIFAAVSGASTQNFSLAYSKQLGSYENDTLTLGYMDLSANGNYYLNISMQSQDDNAANDSIADSTLYIYQDIALDTLFGIDNQMAKVAGDSVWVSALVRNNSNLPVDRFLVRMELDGEEVVTDTVSRHLEAGDTLTHDLSLPYVVPFGSKEQPFYFLEVSAILSCDADNGNDLLNVVGNIHVPDTIDLQVLAIARPSSDSGRVKVNPTVTVANIANTEVYTVMVRVDVLDSAMTLLETVSEYISFININDTVDYGFSLSYTVPNYNGKYFLRAYVDTYTDEVNTANDTLIAQFNCLRNEVAVPDFDDAGWTLGQNRPNPARNATVIPFSLPEDATVTLTVMSASGQLLRSEVIEAAAGENSFSLNVENLAAGIYYYTMEFKGQRLVRKMNVVK